MLTTAFRYERENGKKREIGHREENVDPLDNAGIYFTLHTINPLHRN